MARKTLEFRLYPNRQQRERLTATLAVCRELYNAGLQQEPMHSFRQGFPCDSVTVGAFLTGILRVYLRSPSLQGAEDVTPKVLSHFRDRIG